MITFRSRQASIRRDVAGTFAPGSLLTTSAGLTNRRGAFGLS